MYGLAVLSGMFELDCDEKDKIPLNKYVKGTLSCVPVDKSEAVCEA